MKVLIPFIISLLLISCTITPKVSDDTDNKRCDLATKKLELKLNTNQSMKCNSKDLAACLGLNIVSTTVTGLISGSVVLVGNTVHWIEKQGKCNDSFINTYVTKRNKPLLENNGTPLELQSAKNEKQVPSKE